MTGSRRVLACTLAMFACLASPMTAADETARKAAADHAVTWKFWGKAQVSEQTGSGLQGGRIVHVNISPMPAQPWDIGAEFPVTQVVNKGDVVLLAFWARAARAPQGSDFIGISGRIFEIAPPHEGVTSETLFLLGKDWKLYFASGTAQKDFPAGTLNVGVQLGTGDQAFELGPAFIVDYGSNCDIATLPNN